MDRDGLEIFVGEPRGVFDLVAVQLFPKRKVRFVLKPPRLNINVDRFLVMLDVKFARSLSMLIESYCTR